MILLVQRLTQEVLSKVDGLAKRVLGHSYLVQKRLRIVVSCEVQGCNGLASGSFPRGLWHRLGTELSLRVYAVARARFQEATRWMLRPKARSRAVNLTFPIPRMRNLAMPI